MILSHKKHGTKNHSHKTPDIVAILDLCYTVMNASAQVYESVYILMHSKRFGEYMLQKKRGNYYGSETTGQVVTDIITTHDTVCRDPSDDISGIKYICK